MKKVWFDEAWSDYIYWQTQDKKTIKRINNLLTDIERSYSLQHFLLTVLIAFVNFGR